MRKSFAAVMLTLLAVIVLIAHHFKPSGGANNAAPAVAEQTAQTPSTAPVEPTVTATEATPNVAADSTPSNNGLVTLSLNTGFSSQKPSPEAAKNALAMNTWIKQHVQNVGQ